MPLGIAGIFVDYFSNIFSWIFMAVFVLVGILLGVFLRPWMGNQVIKILPKDHRFIDFDIDEETAVSVQCKKVKGYPIQRFFKLHPGFTGITGRFIKKPITRYLGLEGTAYTWLPEEGSQKFLGTLADAVKAVWGEEFWESVPDKQKSMMDESTIQVTVGLDKSPLTPAGMKPISEEDIKQEEDRQASRTFWSEHGAQMRGYLINLFLAGGTGFGIACVLMLIGIIRFPSEPASAPATAEAIGTVLRSLIH